MTTIAYKDGMIAADGQMSYHKAGVNKLQSLPDGGWVGGAGSGSDVQLAIEYLQAELVAKHLGKERPPKPQIDENKCQLLRIYPDGSLSMYFEKLVEIPLEETFFAIGSGSDYAMGAMAAGYNALSAVEVAARFDKDTGGHIQTKYLGRP